MHVSKSLFFFCDQVKSRSAQSTLSSVSFSLLPGLTVSSPPLPICSVLDDGIFLRLSIISPVKPPNTITTFIGMDTVLCVVCSIFEILIPCSHQEFRPKLVQYIRKKKLDKHKKVRGLLMC